MATIGVDCHFTLRHDAVNGGQAVGFIAAADRRGPLVALTYRRDDTWVWADAGADASSAALEPQMIRFIVPVPLVCLPGR